MSAAITVVALVCHALAGNALCEEVIVTDSNLVEGLDMFQCQMGAQSSLAKWKSEHPIYHTNAYTIQGWKCASGDYILKGRA